MTEAPRAPQTVAEALQAALADHRAGRRTEAQAWYRRIVGVEPAQADALHLLGLLAIDAGLTDIATTLIGRAIAIDLSAPLYRFNLGNALSAAGRIEEAALSYERTLDLQPGHATAARNLGVARVQLASPAAVARFRRRWGTRDDATYHPIDARRRALSGPGYLLIRGWGCGFWGEVNHVAVQIALADIMGRIPLVYWGTEFHYRPPGVDNAWDGYFEPVSGATPADLQNGAHTHFPGHWSAANLWTSQVEPMRQARLANPHGMVALAALNRMESIVVADGYAEMGDVLAWAAPRHPLSGRDAAGTFRMIFDKNLRLKSVRKDTIDQISKRIFSKEPVMAVHFRAQNSIKAMESLELTSLTPEDYFPYIDKFVDSFPQGQIFVLTDVETAVAAFRERFGARVVVLPRNRLMHGEQFDIGLDRSKDLHRLAVEVLEDVYLAAGCDFFVGDGASGVSCSIVALKDWPDGHVHLLRRHVFNERRGAVARS